MTTSFADLERHAVDFMKRGDFGEDAVNANLALTSQQPANVPALVRLGRCYLEQRRWDDAIGSLRAALGIEPSHAIATSLLSEVRKRRALSPMVAQRSTGFTQREFVILETLSPDEARKALGPRIDALFDSVNQTPLAGRVVEARRRNGEIGSKLFHADDHHSGPPGHIFAVHHGGRWEPQFNLGWFSSPPFPRSAMRIGLGFNLSPSGRDADRASGQERALAYFARFQQTIARSWRRQLAEWMAASGGFIQYAGNAPATELLPEKAVEWLEKCHNAAALEWIFIGRWLFLDNPDAAGLLSDRAKLARTVDDTFRSLFPLWLTTYAD